MIGCFGMCSICYICKSISHRRRHLMPSKYGEACEYIFQALSTQVLLKNDTLLRPFGLSMIFFHLNGKNFYKVFKWGIVKSLDFFDTLTECMFIQARSLKCTFGKSTEELNQSCLPVRPLQCKLLSLLLTYLYETWHLLLIIARSKYIDTIQTAHISLNCHTTVDQYYFSRFCNQIYHIGLFIVVKHTSKSDPYNM